MADEKQDPMKPIVVTLPEGILDAYREIGAGNVSEGIRIVLGWRIRSDDYVYGANVRTCVSLPADAVERLRVIGGGNVSNGARIAAMESPSVRERIQEG